ncbi:MAG TPA: hypothetical protein DIW47_00605 [Bacteroidetes bacterium]|nr:hypothetical protein [Bacteroidota bacterium]
MRIVNAGTRGLGDEGTWGRREQNGPFAELVEVNGRAETSDEGTWGLGKESHRSHKAPKLQLRSNSFGAVNIDFGLKKHLDVKT